MDSELRTFNQIFLIHQSIRWKCDKDCDWDRIEHSSGHKLGLKLIVEPGNTRTKVTSILNAIESALAQYLKDDGPKPDTPAPKRGFCDARAVTTPCIVHYPELLVLFTENITPFGSGPGFIKIAYQSLISLSKLTDPSIKL